MTSPFKIIDKNDYKVIHKIGEGAYGYVDKVEKDGKQYAMKTLTKVDARQTYREIDILCRVDYPTIIKFYGYNIESSDNEIVMVFELMKNDLSKVIQNPNENPTFDITKKMICIYGIAKGMEYCHKNNIFHRDLKPDNILLDDNFEPCITDFGLSKVTDLKQGLQQTSIIGTEVYMSPEMRSGGYCNDKSDVYSFGLIVYFMFKGENPPPDICDNVLDLLIQDFPDEIQALIASCCCEEPNDRFSFQQIVEALSNVDNCVDEIDKEAYIEYVNKINNFQSSNDITNKFQFADSSKIRINFSAYIKYQKNEVTNGERILNVVKKITPNQYIVNAFEGKRNLYLLNIFSDVNEQKFIPKIIKYLNLNHYGILKLKGVAVSDDENPTFILKNKVNNGSLTEIIQNEKENKANSDWNLTKKIITLYGVAKAMAYLHSKNIIHHNLCPNNIFFDANFYPHITNFEAFIDSDDVINYKNLDENCIAPEIMNNGIADEKTDVYSFAIIMFYIFAQRYPFSKLFSNKKSKREIIRGSRDVIPDKVPEIFKQIISSCWSKNPDERPAFEKIVEQLQEAINKFDDREFNKVEFKSYENEVLNQENRDLYSDLNQEISKNINNSLNASANKLIEDGQKYIKKYEDETDKKNEYIEKAFECFTKVSEIKGNPSGNYYLGLLYEGFGPIKKSLGLATINFQLALESEDQKIVNDSQLELEKMPNLDLDYINKYASDLYSGNNVAQDKKKAFRYFKIAADQGFAKAMYNCALMLFNGDEIPANKEEASKYYKKAADEGNSSAMYNYSLMLLKGDGIPQNIKEGMSYLIRSVDCGNLMAKNLYAVYLRGGEYGLQQNKIEAAKMFKETADLGNADSMFNYATMKEKGNGVDVDKKEALHYYKMAADKGEPNGMYHYARMMENGDGTEPNLEIAKIYYKRSAKRHNKDAIKAYERLANNKK